MTEAFPAVYPDLDFMAFLDKYLMTHSADDPMFRDVVAKFIESRMDYTGIRLAEDILDGIKNKSGQHPDNQAVQAIVNQEVCFKLARMLMSIAQGSGNLPVTMKYLGQIAADWNQVQVSNRFEGSVQNFLVDVGHLPAGASAEQQMSILNMDAEVKVDPGNEVLNGENDSKIEDEGRSDEEGFDEANPNAGSSNNENGEEEQATTSQAPIKPCDQYSICVCMAHRPTELENLQIYMLGKKQVYYI
jgi:hypothetical protein